MQHRVFGRKFSRDANERKSLFKNLVSSLIIHGYIRTTVAKAKAINGLFDTLVVKARKKTPQSINVIGTYLQNKKAIKRLIDEIAPAHINRPGGFTKIIRLGERKGDGAEIVRLEIMEGKPVEKVVSESKSKQTETTEETKLKTKPKSSPKPKITDKK